MWAVRVPPTTDGMSHTLPGTAGRAATDKEHFVSEHKDEELKGRTKEAAGALTGDKDLKREGRVDRASASIKDKVGDAADAVKDAVTSDRDDR